MSWTSHKRTGYEAALVRARRELVRAGDHAGDADDEGVLEDLLSLRLEIQRLIDDSLTNAGRKAVKPPLRGQQTL